jgi:hypothetical protein
MGVEGRNLGGGSNWRAAWLVGEGSRVASRRELVGGGGRRGRGWCGGREGDWSAAAAGRGGVAVASRGATTSRDSSGLRRRAGVDEKLGKHLKCYGQMGGYCSVNSTHELEIGLAGLLGYG